MSDGQTTATENTTTEAPAEKKQRGQGIGKRAKDLIREGKSNKDVLETLQKEFPTAKTTMASVNWYRNNLRAKGEKVPSAREVKAAEAPKAEAKAEGGEKLADALS
jgi:hypothetical protein